MYMQVVKHLLMGQFPGREDFRSSVVEIEVKHCHRDNILKVNLDTTRIACSYLASSEMNEAIYTPEVCRSNLI